MTIEAVSEILETISFVLVTPQFLPPDRAREIRVRLKILLKRFNRYLGQNAISGPWFPKTPIYRFLLFMVIFPFGSALGFLWLSFVVSVISWILGYSFSGTFSFIRAHGVPLGFALLIAATMAFLAGAIVIFLNFAIAISTEWRLFCMGAVLFGVSKAIAICLALRVG